MAEGEQRVDGGERGVGTIAGTLSGEHSADGVRSSLRRRSLDESERLADAFAEKLLTDGGDIGDDEALAQGVSPQGRGFEPHSSPRSYKTSPGRTISHPGPSRKRLAWLV